MFLGFRNWLNKLDDEKFLADMSTPEGRKEKIAKLRRARWLYIFLSIYLVCAMILMVYLFPSVVFSSTIFSMVFGLFLLSGMSFAGVDSQIKMLLFLDKTRPQ